MNWRFSCLTAFAFMVAAGTACSTSEEDDTIDEGEEAFSIRGPVDQAAIVESTTLMLASMVTLSTKFDPYNVADPFAIAPANFEKRFVDSLAKVDHVDGFDWPEPAALDWAERMANGNYIVIDTSKPCDYENANSYLEIERAFYTGRKHTTCGGRTPNEDAADVTFNFMARGPGASVVDKDALHDGVAQATKKSSSEFPYLADLNGP